MESPVRFGSTSFPPQLGLRCRAGRDYPLAEEGRRAGRPTEYATRPAYFPLGGTSRVSTSPRARHSARIRSKTGPGTFADSPTSWDATRNRGAPVGVPTPSGHREKSPSSIWNVGLSHAICFTAPVVRTNPRPESSTRIFAMVERVMRAPANPRAAKRPPKTTTTSYGTVGPRIPTSAMPPMNATTPKIPRPANAIRCGPNLRREASTVDERSNSIAGPPDTTPRTWTPHINPFRGTIVPATESSGSVGFRPVPGRTFKTRSAHRESPSDEDRAPVLPPVGVHGRAGISGPSKRARDRVSRPM
jgi:hypothetical protein